VPTDIILSLVRTRSIGYLRDIRRLTVALSRARLGLFVLGRAAVFESCFELKPAFDILLSRPTKLTLVTDEMYEPSFARQITDKIEESSEAVMEGVEHLGQYVFEMTKAKVEALKAGGGEVVAVNAGDAMVVDGEEDGDREENVIVEDEEEFAEEDADGDGVQGAS
jgi:intron-binding protein aquarius